MNSPKTDSSKQQDQPNLLLGPSHPGWRRWLTRITMISVLFVVLLVLFNLLGVIVEKFFITIYVD